MWSYDFVAARTEDGRALRMLVVIDEFTRECLTIEVGRSFTSDDVIGVLQYLFAIRGVPGHIRSENGPEFVAKGIRRWLIVRWRLDANHRRPHSALGYQTPAAFAANCVLEDSATLHPPEHRTITDLKLSH